MVKKPHDTAICDTISFTRIYITIIFLKLLWGIFMISEFIPSQSSFFADSVSFVCFGPFWDTQLNTPHNCADEIWVLLYVDQGTLAVSVSGCHFTLSHSRFLISPLSLLRLSCSADPAPLRIISFAFSCSSPFLCLLSGRILRATRPECMLFAQLLAKVTDHSASRLPDDSQSCVFMECLLNRLLIRRFQPVSFSLPANRPGSFSLPIQPTDRQYLSILRYLKRNLRTQLTLGKICRDNLISRSRLEQLFHEKGWHGVMDCFSHMKIDAAKSLLAEGNMTVTQLSAALGYSSVHYFSRQFKGKTKMTPTEYSSFLKEHTGDVMSSLSRYYTVDPCRHG